MSAKLLLSIFSGIVSFMPDSVKTILCKVFGILLVTAGVFIAGFYFGWEQKTADVLEEQIRYNSQINQTIRKQTAGAVQKSDEIALQIQKETQLAYEREQKQKELSEKSAVLELPLPNDVVRLLNDASRPSANGSAR